MSEVGRRRRRKELQGCAVALVLFGGFLAAVALAIAAVTASSPLNGISRVVLGLGAIALNRPLAESGALGLLLAADSASSGVPEGPSKRSSQPHWYSPGRLVFLVVGLFLVTSGVMRILGFEVLQPVLDELAG